MTARPSVACAMHCPRFDLRRPGRIRMHGSGIAAAARRRSTVRPALDRSPSPFRRQRGIRVIDDPYPVRVLDRVVTVAMKNNGRYCMPGSSWRGVGRRHAHAGKSAAALHRSHGRRDVMRARIR